MFNGVKKIAKAISERQESKPMNVKLNLGSVTKKEPLVGVSKNIIRFDENLEKFKPMDMAELKNIYKDLGGKPNIFLNRETLIYLISKKQIQNEGE